MTAPVPYGVAMIDGRQFAILYVRLESSQVRFHLHACGPFPAGRGYPTIFGIDGSGIFQGPTELEWSAREAGKCVDLAVHLIVEIARPVV